MDNRHSGYLSPVFNRKEVKKTIKRCRQALKTIDYDAIVVTGVSGLSVGATIAYLTGKQLIVVRKEDEQSHACFRVEGLPVTDFKYVILDDFICSGDTVIKIAQKMKECVKYSKAEFVGLIQYSENRKTLCVSKEEIWKHGFQEQNQDKFEKFRNLI